MKLHLVDGTFELFRAYYGAPSSTSPSGQEVGATRSFLRNIFNLLKEDDVTHIGIAFDHVIESFRNDLFDGYKTGEGIEPELWKQFPLVEEASYALGVVTWPMVDFEADDGIASAAHKFKSKVDQVVLASPDKDLAQLVTGKEIILWDRLREKTYDEKGVKEKYGVFPKSIPDYLALVGDSADGVPGIPRWGAKSASTLLARYDKIEKIPKDFEKWDVKVRGAKALAENLENEYEEALLYRTLTTLRKDAPIKESWGEMKWKAVDKAHLLKFCEKIGDTRIPKQI